MSQRSPFRYIKTNPEIIRLAVMLNIRFPLWLRNFEDLLYERGVEISHETVRFGWTRFGAGTGGAYAAANVVEFHNAVLSEASLRKRESVPRRAGLRTWPEQEDAFRACLSGACGFSRDYSHDHAGIAPQPGV